MIPMGENSRINSRCAGESQVPISLSIRASLAPSTAQPNGSVDRRIRSLLQIKGSVSVPPVVSSYGVLYMGETLLIVRGAYSGTVLAPARLARDPGVGSA